MRLFTGIQIPGDVKEKLGSVLAQLRPLARLRWSPVENLHITTKFIGEWPEDRLAEMKGALAVVGRTGAIEIEILGVGWFPTSRNARVFWAGVKADQWLASLAQATQQAVARIGVPVEERVYSPHLTLGRVPRERVSLDALREAAAKFESESFGVFRASSFFLYSSAGGKYTKLAEFAFE